MSYEVGGRADKFGNRYESRWVVKQLLRVISEDIYSVIVEAIGPEEEGVDVWVINNDITKDCYQCKGRNASKEEWTIGDLNRKDILKKSKVQLDMNSETTFALISPISCTMLNDLHMRAVNGNSSAKSFYESQVKTSSKEMNSFFDKYCEYMNLNIITEKDLNKAYDYLKRTSYYQYADDINEKRNILDRIDLYFIGNSEIIYSLLANYCIENDLLGHEITSKMIISYLKGNGINPRDLALDDRIMPRINTLNEEFMDSFSPINNRILNRNEVEICVDEIEKGNSIIIHGKAGSGKSGCVYELLEALEERNIVTLALKLDRRIPKDSAQKYGENLELPTSPAHCIHALCKFDRGVLIFDQLDAIRWTNNHSNTAIEVCKQMIRQIQQLNRERKHDISIIFVCRTYDYENDNGIKSLFQEKSQEQDMKWKEICIGELDEKVVAEVVGNKYNSFSNKMKSILKTINNLYIWIKLDDEHKENEIKSSTELIKLWWEQLVFNYEKNRISTTDLKGLKNKIVNILEESGKLVVSKRLFKDYSPLPIQYLVSEGLLNSNLNNIMFVHQSFFDYFLVEQMLEDLYNGINIADIIGEINKQTPMRRYQVQMLLQILQEEDFDFFVSLGEEIISNKNIRFFIKYVYLEVLSQSIIITYELENLLDKYIGDNKFNKYFFDTVFIGHELFILHLIKRGYINKWLLDNNKNLAITFLRSVNDRIQNEIIREITPFLFENKELDYSLYECFCLDVCDDSNEMFSIRLKLLEKYPDLLGRYIDFKEIFNKNHGRALLIMKSMIENLGNSKRSDIVKYSDEIFHDIDDVELSEGIEAFELLFPLIPLEVEYYSQSLKGWINRFGEESSVERACVKILKKAIQVIITNNVDLFIELLNKHIDCNAIVVNEIFLESAISVPEEYSDEILKWLVSNKSYNLFDRSSKEEDELFYAKKILDKFSKNCSDDIFQLVEKKIYYYHEPDEKDILKRRIEFSQNKGEHVYWSYWGEVQYSLLPHLDKTRISIKVKNLIQVLNRNFEGKYLRHIRDEGHSGLVSASILPRAKFFSDKMWIKVITNKNILESYNSKWIDAERGFYTSSIREFAETFERIGKNNPVRFADLALKLPTDIADSYINAIYSIIGCNERKEINDDSIDWKPVPLEIAQKIIMKFGCNEEKYYAISLCRSIENRSDEEWNTDIIKIICNIAKFHLDPEEKKVIVTNNQDKEMRTFEMLLSNSINCTRGAAAEAIGRLLWDHTCMFKMVRSSVESLMSDNHPAVRMASIGCLCPIYNIDREWVQEKIINLFETDIRIAAHRNSHQLVYLMYNKYKERLNNVIEQMFYSEDKDVCRIGAGYACNLHVLYDEFKNLIFSDEHRNDDQKQGIIEVAIDLFDKENHINKCKKILMMFLNQESDIGSLYNRLFFERKLDIIRDKKFISNLFKAKISRRIVHYLVEYLQNSEKEVLGFADIILELCNEIIIKYSEDAKNPQYDLYGIESELSKLLIGLYDESILNKDINIKCLDMWDLMFEYRIGSIRNLSKAIMDY